MRTHAKRGVCRAVVTFLTKKKLVRKNRTRRPQCSNIVIKPPRRQDKDGHRAWFIICSLDSPPLYCWALVLVILCDEEKLCTQRGSVHASVSKCCCYGCWWMLMILFELIVWIACILFLKDEETSLDLNPSTAPANRKGMSRRRGSVKDLLISDAMTTPIPR